MLRRQGGEFSSAEIHALFSPVLEAPNGSPPTLGLAVSGGADSLALMLLVARWREIGESFPQVIVYSLDHRLRPEAAGEVAFVIKLARDLGFEARGLTLSGSPEKITSQADARHLRYKTIAGAMAEDGVTTLLTGHHRQDQAETVLMRLAHGSGVEGLGGMGKFSNIAGIRIFRPLLDVAPARLRQVVADAAIQPVEDPSNQHTKYERTRWRQALPELDQLGLSEKRLADFSARMARAEAALAKVSRSLFSDNVVSGAFGLWKMDRETFFEQPAEIGIRLLSAMIAQASGRGRRVELSQLESAHFCLQSAPAEALTLGGCVLQLSKDELRIFRESGRIENAVMDLMPHTKTLWDQRFTIENLSDEPVVIGPATRLSRVEAERIAGASIQVPMAAVRAAPLVRDGAGRVLGLGTKGLADRVKICLAPVRSARFMASEPAQLDPDVKLAEPQEGPLNLS